MKPALGKAKLGKNERAEMAGKSRSHFQSEQQCPANPMQVFITNHVLLS